MPCEDWKDKKTTVEKIRAVVVHVNDCVGHQMAALYHACLIISIASNINTPPHLEQMCQISDSGVWPA